MAIVKRKDGGWQARHFRGYDGHGKRLENTKCFETKRAAEEWLTEERRRLGMGEWTPPSAQTLAQYCEQWMAGRLVNSERRAYTIESYTFCLRSYVLPFLGPIRLDRLTQGVVQSFADRLIQQRSKRGAKPENERPTLSRKTVRYALQVLSAVLRDSKKQGAIARNPVEDIDVRATQERPPRWFEADEFLRLLDANADDRYTPLWALLGYSGLRLGEALGMTWEFCDLENAAVAVVQSLTPSKEASGWSLTDPKTKSSKRVVPLPAAAVAALESHRSRQQVEKIVAGDRWVDCGHAFVFTDAKGQPLKREDMPRRLAAACRRASLPVITPRDLRHTYNSLTHAAGLDGKLRAELSGHTHDRITDRVYTHVAPARLREAVERFGEYMASKRAET